MKTTEQQHNDCKREPMEKHFAGYTGNGLTGTGIKAQAKACGCTKGNRYCCFKNPDEWIIESTASCMAQVEDDCMEKAPYWTAKRHGKKYRLKSRMEVLKQGVHLFMDQYSHNE